MSLPDVTAHSLEQLVSLKGRAAAVTGAAWGPGKAIARRLAEAGAAVVIADIDEAQAAQAAAELSATGAVARSLRMDAADPAQIEATAAFAEAELGGLDHNPVGVSGHARQFAKMRLNVPRRPQRMKRL